MSFNKKNSFGFGILKISLTLLLMGIWIMTTPAPVRSHSAKENKHDLEKLEPKPKGMIGYQGDQPVSPGSEYEEPAPTRKESHEMTHSDHMQHGQAHDSGKSFFKRGAHDLMNPSPSLTQGQALLARGQNIFQHMCSFCHGKDGNGGGTATDYLYPWPRDFRKGIFKFRSTPTGTLPRDKDLYRTIIRGVPGTSMPSWQAALSPQDTWALVNLIKSFSTRFREEPPGKPITINPVASSSELIQRGKELFKKHKCANCHGESLKGDGKVADSLMDAWKHAVFVHDVTNPNYLKSGHEPEDLYQTITTGLDGTPMESYALLPEEDRWALVHFIRSRFTKKYKEAEYETDLFSYPKEFESTTDPNSPIWEGVRSTDLHLRPLSARRGAVETINFASVNNGEDIAIRLRWEDPTKNGYVENRGDVYQDGVAVQIALGGVTLHTHGHNEPFFGMGNRGKPVNIWHWKAGLEETLEASEDSEYSTGGVDMDALIYGSVMASPVVRLQSNQENTVDELNAEGFGTITPQLPGLQNVQGAGEWKDGIWTVVFLRPLKNTGNWDARLQNRKEPALVALAVWDGDKEDRNGRKVVSVWQRLNVLSKK